MPPGRNFLTCYLPGLQLTPLYWSLTVWSAGRLRKKTTTYRCNLLPQCPSASFWLRSQAWTRKTRVLGCKRQSDHDWQQLYKAPVWQRHTQEHTNNQHNRSVPPQMRSRWRTSLARCCLSKLVKGGSRRRQHNSKGKWVWDIMQRKTISNGGRGAEDAVTSDLKPRDGAC